MQRTSTHSCMCLLLCLVKKLLELNLLILIIIMSSSEMAHPFVSPSRTPRKVLRATLLVTGLLAIIALGCFVIDSFRSPSSTFLAK